jgi:hypothetical protein
MGLADRTAPRPLARRRVIDRLRDGPALSNACAASRNKLRNRSADRIGLRHPGRDGAKVRAGAKRMASGDDLGVLWHRGDYSTLDWRLQEGIGFPRARASPTPGAA